jgi:hypothetical protein
MKMMLEDLEVNMMHWNNKRLTLPTTQKAVISVNAQPHALVDPAPRTTSTVELGNGHLATKHITGI